MEVEEPSEKSNEEKEKINGESEMEVSEDKSEQAEAKSGETSLNKSLEESPDKTNGKKSPVKEEVEEKAVKMEVEDLSVKKENEDSPIKKESEDSLEKKEDEKVQVKKEEEESIVKKELSELVKEETEPQDLTSIKEKDKGANSDPGVKEEVKGKGADDTEQKVRDIVKDIKRQTTEEMAKSERKKDIKCTYDEEVWLIIVCVNCSISKGITICWLVNTLFNAELFRIFSL